MAPTGLCAAPARSPPPLHNLTLQRASPPVSQARIRKAFRALACGEQTDVLQRRGSSARAAHSSAPFRATPPFRQAAATGPYEPRDARDPVSECAADPEAPPRDARGGIKFADHPVCTQSPPATPTPRTVRPCVRPCEEARTLMP